MGERTERERHRQRNEQRQPESGHGMNRLSAARGVVGGMIDHTGGLLGLRYTGAAGAFGRRGSGAGSVASASEVEAAQCAAFVAVGA